MTGLVSIYQHAFQSSYGSTTRATATGGIAEAIRRLSKATNTDGSLKVDPRELDEACYDMIETTHLDTAHAALVAAHDDLDRAVEETRIAADANTALEYRVGVIAGRVIEQEKLIVGGVIDQEKHVVEMGKEFCRLISRLSSKSNWSTGADTWLASRAPVGTRPMKIETDLAEAKLRRLKADAQRITEEIQAEKSVEELEELKADAQRITEEIQAAETELTEVTTAANQAAANQAADKLPRFLKFARRTAMDPRVWSIWDLYDEMRSKDPDRVKKAMNTIKEDIRKCINVDFEFDQGVFGSSGVHLGDITVEGCQRFFIDSEIPLTQLPMSIGALVVRGSFRMHHNQLVSLPPSFALMEIGEDLCLWGNAIVRLPVNFGHLHIQKKVDIGSNGLFMLPASISRLRIDELLLSRNRLFQLPDNFDKIRLSDRIDLSYNAFTYLPQIAGIWETEIPWSSTGAPLRRPVLELCNNSISTLDSKFTAAVINILGDDIAKLTSDFEVTQIGRVLNLNDNPITSKLPRCVTTTQTLLLAGNKISSLPTGFKEQLMNAQKTKKAKQREFQAIQRKDIPKYRVRENNLGPSTAWGHRGGNTTQSTLTNADHPRGSSTKGGQSNWRRSGDKSQSDTPHYSSRKWRRDGQ